MSARPRSSLSPAAGRAVVLILAALAGIIPGAIANAALATVALAALLGPASAGAASPAAPGLPAVPPLIEHPFPPDGLRAVRTVRFDGPAGSNLARLAELASDLTHQPLSLDRLAAKVRDLESFPGVGGLAVEWTGADALDVLFRFDGRPRRLARLEFAWDDAPVDDARSWEFLRRVEAATDGFRLVTGEPYHPFLRDLDVETVRAYYVARGFRDVRIDARETEEAATPAAGALAQGLVDLTLRIATGRRYVAAAVTLTGDTLGADPHDALLSALRTQPEEPLSAEDLAADRARIALAQCRLGHPLAAVTFHEGPAADTLEGDRQVPIAFAVSAGPFVRTDRVQVVGRFVPWTLVGGLPLHEGDPFCPRLLDESRERIRDFLRDRGFPDPVVSAATRRRLQRDGTRATAVTFIIESVGDVRIERIWLRGNRVTHEEIVRQHFAFGAGQLYQQSAVDASIQALRRSGLFKSVEARVVPGTRPGNVYLVFDLVEQGPVSVNVGRQQLILRNLDVTNWPSDYEQFEQARACRGAGQVLSVFAQPDRKGVEWTDEYVARFLVAELNLNRQLGSTSAFDETWYTLGVGLGPKAMQGRVAVIPFGELEWTRIEQASGEDVPVLDGDAMTLAGGLKVRLDLNRRDEERIPYLGFDADLRGRAGASVAGESFDFTDFRAQVRLHLPLWLTRSRQHFVLRLSGDLSEVFADDTRKLQAHQRFFPQARGYGSRAMGVTFPLTNNQELKLGGLHAAEAGAEVRLPMPWGRRNAFSPFWDAGTVGDEAGDLLHDPWHSLGLAYAFSLFSERVEGVVWGACALHEKASPTWTGASLGGNF